jgi:glutathione S-transferase
MLELFHAINSVGAQKVRIQLAEKQLDWNSHLMTLEGDQFTSEYLKMNPNGVVPTLLHDGVIVVESTVILFYLEDCFPAVRLMPYAPRDKAAVRMYTKLIDEYVHNACTIVTFATAMRRRFQAMDAEDREKYLSSAPDQKRTEYKRDVIASGLESRFVGEALSHFMKLLTWISKSTADHTYLAGSVYSLADVAVLPYVARLDHLRLSQMWSNLPNVRRWYDRVNARPAAQQAIYRCMSEADRALFTECDVDPWSKVSKLVESVR